MRFQKEKHPAPDTLKEYPGIRPSSLITLSGK